MEELSNHWQEEQERAEDGAEKCVIVFTNEALAYLIFLFVLNPGPCTCYVVCLSCAINCGCAALCLA